MLKKNQIKKFLNKIKSKPYIIAEVGVNHECSIKKAKKRMILMAKKRRSRCCKISDIQS